MNTLFNADLSCREFSSHLLHVGDLMEWAKSKRLHIRTAPAIDGGDFVQVEALLCGIERHASDLTLDQALEIVLNSPTLKNDPTLQKYPDDIDPTHCRWLIGATAHSQWRKIIAAAIDAHELALLDFGSKLPIDAAPKLETAAPVAAEHVELEKSGPMPVTTRAMADSFAGLHWDSVQWIKKLGDKPRWLDACMVLNRGRGEGMRLWNPVLIGSYLVRMRHVKAKSVRAKFQTQPALKQWLEDWKTYEADNHPTD